MHEAVFRSGLASNILDFGIIFVLSIHAATNPINTATKGIIFRYSGRTMVGVDHGRSHRTAAPPQIDVADIVSIGITTFLSSMTELRGL